MASFRESCYALLRRVPQGTITTYGDIAHALHSRAYRAVGSAMHNNPYPITEVPCHRVVNSDGSLGGYAFETEKKIALLKKEGISVEHGKIKDFKKVRFNFQ